MAIHHVIYNPDGGWSVKKHGASRATRTFQKQPEAIAFGRQVAKRQKTDLFVHRRDGTIREVFSYADNAHSLAALRK